MTVVANAAKPVMAPPGVQSPWGRRHIALNHGISG